MLHSIIGLDCRYTISQEFVTRFHSEWVIRFCNKFVCSAKEKFVAENFAKVHSGMKGA